MKKGNHQVFQFVVHYTNILNDPLGLDQSYQLVQTPELTNGYHLLTSRLLNIF